MKFDNFDPEKMTPSVYDQCTPSSIQSMFNSIAPTYDRVNWFMSSGIHVMWNTRLVSNLMAHLPANNKNVSILDLCCGTGEITFRYANRLQRYRPHQKVHFTGIDFSHGMLEEARKREHTFSSPSLSFDFVQADATELPLLSESYDQVAIAYGVRNIHRRNCLFNEIFRILKPNGTLAILELTRPSSRILQYGHSWYVHTIVPLIGKIISRNKQSYSYLSKSIHEFVSPSLLGQELQEAGFKKIQIRRLTFGTATLFTATK